MKIVLLGANGRTGRAVLKRALDAGDAVTALVRDREALAEFASPKLDVHMGDVCDPQVVASLLGDQDVVISALGPRSPRAAHCRIYARSADAIVEAMEASPVRRLIVTSTALLFDRPNLFDRAVRLIARNNYRYAGMMEARIRASTLDWTLVRVGFLNTKDATTYRAAVDRFPGGGISRAALAAYLHEEAAAGRHGRGVVGLAG